MNVSLTLGNQRNHKFRFEIFPRYNKHLFITSEVIRALNKGALLIAENVFSGAVWVSG